MAVYQATLSRHGSDAKGCCNGRRFPTFPGGTYGRCRIEKGDLALRDHQGNGQYRVSCLRRQRRESRRLSRLPFQALQRAGIPKKKDRTGFGWRERIDKGKCVELPELSPRPATATFTRRWCAKCAIASSTAARMMKVSSSRTARAWECAASALLTLAVATNQSSTKIAVHGLSITEKSTILPNSALNSRTGDIVSVPRPIPKLLSISMKRWEPTAFRSCAACLRLRFTTGQGGSCCWRAIVSARSRCTTRC